MEILTELLSLAASYEHELPPSLAGGEMPRGNDLATYIDHTLLKPEATASQVKDLCAEAIQYRFAAVCINPAYVPLARGLLYNSTVSICTVVGFPLGANLPSYKAYETLACLEAGATEIDMVLNIGAMKGGAYGQVYNEIQAVAQVCHNQNALVKVILETALLTYSEKIIACLICKAAGANFVKTSTGFGPAGAKIEDVDLMRRIVGTNLGVKASGGIRTLSDATAMIRAGANRLGTSSGVKILQETQA